MWKKRKKIWSFLSIIAIIAIIGLVAACGDGSAEEEEIEPDFPGRVTITNFDGLTGLTAGTYLYGRTQFGARNLILVASTPTASLIPARPVEGDTITLYMYQVIGTGEQRTFRRFADTIHFSPRTFLLREFDHPYVSWGAGANEAWRNTPIIRLVNGVSAPLDFEHYFENVEPGDPGIGPEPGCDHQLCNCAPRCLCLPGDPPCYIGVVVEPCPFTGAACVCIRYVCVVGGVGAGAPCCIEGGCVMVSVGTCECTADNHCGPVFGGPCGNPVCPCALIHGTCNCNADAFCGSVFVGPCGVIGCDCSVQGTTCLCDPNDPSTMCGIPGSSAPLTTQAAMSCCN